MKVNISKNYEDRAIFNGFNIEFVENKINVILGPSGCGKTTLLHCIANITDYEGIIERQTTDLSFIFQEDRLFPYLTVMKNLLIINDNQDEIIHFLKSFNVYDLKDKYPKQLSGGEKQRIALIRAFINHNKMILMDEPFKSLDYNLKVDLVEQVGRMQQNNNQTIILVTHDLDIAMYLGHMIHILSSKETQVIDTIYNPYVFSELSEKSVKLRNEIKQLIR